jgi:hypothetical protein
LSSPKYFIIEISCTWKKENGKSDKFKMEKRKENGELKMKIGNS